MMLPRFHPLAIAYVNLDERYVLLNGGDRLPIVKMLDEDGDECEPDEAAVVVAGNDHGWWQTPVAFVDPRKLN